MSLFNRKPAKLKGLEITKVALVDAGANPDAHIMLFKHEDGDPAASEKTVDAPEAHEPVNKEVAPVADNPETTPEADLTALQDAIDTAVAKALADHDAALAELATPDAAETEDPIAKALADMPEPVRKRFEEQEAEIAKARATAEKLEKAARDSRFADEAKAVSLTAVDAATLDEIEKAAPAAYEKLAKALATAQERLEKSDLFRELGSNGDAAGDTPADQLDAIAKKLAADENLPYTEAYRRACDQNRELAASAVRPA